MDTLEKSIFSTLAYYDVFDYPLTLTEIWKYLHNLGPKISRRPSLGQIEESLKKSSFLRKHIIQKNGFYFFPSSRSKKSSYTRRIEAQKIADLKWKKVRKIVKFLQIAPYVKMIGITGSLALGCPKEKSDLDLFIITAPQRIWTVRMIITALVHLTGQRRYGDKIANRVCLNSYIAQNALKIEPENLYSAHEYAHLVPLFDKGAYQEFKENNLWINKYLSLSFSSGRRNQKNIKPSLILGGVARLTEIILNTFLGDIVEKRLAQRQKERILKKLKNEQPESQIAFNDNCLVFHPNPKSLLVGKKYNLKMKQFLLNYESS